MDPVARSAAQHVAKAAHNIPANIPLVAHSCLLIAHELEDNCIDEFDDIYGNDKDRDCQSELNDENEDTRGSSDLDGAPPPSSTLCSQCTRATTPHPSQVSFNFYFYFYSLLTSLCRQKESTISSILMTNKHQFLGLRHPHPHPLCALNILGLLPPILPKYYHSFFFLN